MEDENDLVKETANFLQELCVRAEEVAAASCPAELLGCPSTSSTTPPPPSSPPPPPPTYSHACEGGGVAHS